MTACAQKLREANRRFSQRLVAQRVERFSEEDDYDRAEHHRAMQLATDLGFSRDLVEKLDPADVTELVRVGDALSHEAMQDDEDDSDPEENEVRRYAEENAKLFPAKFASRQVDARSIGDKLAEGFRAQRKRDPSLTAKKFLEGSDDRDVAPPERARATDRSDEAREVAKIKEHFSAFAEHFPKGVEVTTLVDGYRIARKHNAKLTAQEFLGQPA